MVSPKETKVKNPAFNVENLLAQRLEDLAPPESVQLHNSKIDSRGKNDQKFGRWQPVVIENKTSGGWTVRHARGGQVKPGLTHNSIVLDYDGTVDLGLLKGQANTVVVRPARWTEVYRYYYHSKHSIIRITTRMAVLGIVLGVVGLVLGVFGLAVSLA